MESWVRVWLLDEGFIFGVCGVVLVVLVLLGVLVGLGVMVEFYELGPEVEGSAQDGCVYEVLD